jgi:hypothetical protein
MPVPIRKKSNVVNLGQVRRQEQKRKAKSASKIESNQQLGLLNRICIRIKSLFQKK